MLTRTASAAKESNSSTQDRMCSTQTITETIAAFLTNNKKRGNLIQARNLICIHDLLTTRHCHQSPGLALIDIRCHQMGYPDTLSCNNHWRPKRVPRTIRPATVSVPGVWQWRDEDFRLFDVDNGVLLLDAQTVQLNVLLRRRARPAQQRPLILHNTPHKLQ